MSTVILKWNPGFSSYSMYRCLYDIIESNFSGEFSMNWSVWEHEKVKKGDTFYMVKVGYGATGIVGRGTITSEPYRGEDWSGQGRETYYVDMDIEMFINPSAAPILTSSTLSAKVPEFDWYKGKSGTVLEPDAAEKLENAWAEFVDANTEILSKRAEVIKNRYNDKVFWAGHQSK